MSAGNEPRRIGVAVAAGLLLFAIVIALLWARAFINSRTNPSAAQPAYDAYQVSDAAGYEAAGGGPGGGEGVRAWPVSL